MCNSFCKGSVEVDVERQAWVRKHPKPAEPKQHGLLVPKVTRDPNVTRRLQQGDYSVPPPIYHPPEPTRPTHGLGNDNGLRRAQTTHRQQRYEGIPNYSQQESERTVRGRGDDGRSRHDDRGLGHAQSTRSQHGSRPSFVEDDADDEFRGEPIHESGISELEGLPTQGQRHGGLRHHGSHGSSRGQHDGRGRSRAPSNPGHGGPGQQSYDLAPPTDRMRAQYPVGHNQRGSEHQVQHDSHRGSQRESGRR